MLHWLWKKVSWIFVIALSVTINFVAKSLLTDKFTYNELGHHYPISCTRISIGIYCHDFAIAILEAIFKHTSCLHVKPKIFELLKSSGNYCCSNYNRSNSVRPPRPVLWKGIRLTTFKNIYYPKVQKKLQ